MGITGSKENQEKKPVVLIVGGGYGGIACAKALDKTGRFFVILIDRKSYFLHNIAALRAVVEPSFCREIMTPYDRLLCHGCFVQAEVTSISETEVRVHGHSDPIKFDYLVIATGSSYAFPGKIAETQVSKAIESYENISKKLAAAEKVLVIGGGPVGIELAGEIATDFPSKQVTLLHSQTTLLTPNVYKENLYRRLNEGLERLNVKVILDDRVLLMNNLPSNFIEGKQHFVTEKKKIPIESDLTFICIGAFVNNKSIENGPLKSKLNIETRRLNVNEFLQVEGFENIFAVGDIAEKEDKLAYIAGEQGTYVGKFISQLEQKKKKIEPYRGREQKLIVLSIGRNSGAAQLPFAGTTVLGGFPVKQIKSKNLFTDRYRSELNYLSESKLNAAKVNRVHSLQQIFSFSEEEAQEFLQGFPVKDAEPGQNHV